MTRSTNASARVGPLLLMAAGLLLLVATLVLALGPRLAAPATPVSEESEDTFPEVDRLSLEDSKSVFDAGTAVFVDVRDPSSYAAGHIPGAVSIPLATIEQRLGELDPQAWIITYCT